MGTPRGTAGPSAQSTRPARRAGRRRDRSPSDAPPLRSVEPASSRRSGSSLSPASPRPIRSSPTAMPRAGVQNHHPHRHGRAGRGGDVSRVSFDLRCSTVEPRRRGPDRHADAGPVDGAAPAERSCRSPRGPSVRSRPRGPDDGATCGDTPPAPLTDGTPRVGDPARADRPERQLHLHDRLHPHATARSGNADAIGRRASPPTPSSSDSTSSTNTAAGR